LVVFTGFSNSTLVLQYSSTPVLQYSSTPVPQYSSTIVPDFMFPVLQVQGSTGISTKASNSITSITYYVHRRTAETLIDAIVLV
jgi:hypothetical protein